MKSNEKLEYIFLKFKNDLKQNIFGNEKHLWELNDEIEEFNEFIRDTSKIIFVIILINIIIKKLKIKLY